MEFVDPVFIGVAAERLAVGDHIAIDSKGFLVLAGPASQPETVIDEELPSLDICHGCGKKLAHDETRVYLADVTNLYPGDKLLYDEVLCSDCHNAPPSSWRRNRTGHKH